MHVLWRAALLRMCKISNLLDERFAESKYETWFSQVLDQDPPKLFNLRSHTFGKVIPHRNNMGKSIQCTNDQPDNTSTINVIRKKLRRNSTHVASKRIK